jgi:hypothetical protein
VGFFACHFEPAEPPARLQVEADTKWQAGLAGLIENKTRAVLQLLEPPHFAYGTLPRNFRTAIIARGGKLASIAPHAPGGRG